MKQVYKLLLILAVFSLPVNFVLAEENPFVGEVDAAPNLNRIEFKDTTPASNTNNQAIPNNTASNIQADDNFIVLNTLNLGLGK